jgi:Luciferase-like monooxygenase
MKVSYFETARYRAPGKLPPEWPVPPAAYDLDAGAEAYRGMVDRARHVERLGFDWVSVSEHHYSPRRLTPAPIVAASHLAAHSARIKSPCSVRLSRRAIRCGSPRNWRYWTI